MITPEEREGTVTQRSGKVRQPGAAGRPLRTSDLAATATAAEAVPPDAEERSEAPPTAGDQPSDEARTEQLEPLFSVQQAEEFRSRWIAVQGSFVDDPRRAVQQGDELVAQVMKSLAESFAEERASLEDNLVQTGDASTEVLRVSLRRYRSFFERLLSL